MSNGLIALLGVILYMLAYIGFVALVIFVIVRVAMFALGM